MPARRRRFEWTLCFWHGWMTTTKNEVLDSKYTATHLLCHSQTSHWNFSQRTRSFPAMDKGVFAWLKFGSRGTKIDDSVNRFWYCYLLRNVNLRALGEVKKLSMEWYIFEVISNCWSPSGTFVKREYAGVIFFTPKQPLYILNKNVFDLTQYICTDYTSASKSSYTSHILWISPCQI